MMDAIDCGKFEDAESAMCLMLMRLMDPLIDHPEECTVEVVRREESVNFVVCVTPDDMERFTGQNMRTGKSLQIIVGAVGAKSQRRFSLTFLEKAGTCEKKSGLLQETSRT